MEFTLSEPDKEELISLAINLGYSKERILFFSDIEELREFAISKGETKNRVLEYGDGTLGLHIQVDEIPKGNDVYFCIRNNYSISDYSDLVGRLDEADIQLPDLILRNTKSMALPVFLLFHEIAHHTLGHVNPPNPDIAETEADQWAIDQINKNF